ncbi:MAG: glycosyltransferase [Methylococcaceae bacterium]|nr:glycosyltransferase [Methylococcaceae bacterium]
MYYLKANPQIESLHINPLLHYLYYGRQEGLKPLPDPLHSDFSNQQQDLNTFNWDSFTKHSNPSHASIDIIVPVYQGQYETLQCLHSVLSSNCSISYELIVIDDASPDFELSEQLRKLANKGLIKLISNSTNHGFIYSVNRGMSLHKDRDVVLLNSDTEVYNDWLERLAYAAYRNRLTGTVTPMSNNATICSYPRFLHDNPYPLEIGYAELDALYAKLNKNKQVEAPTGVGFCMYIKRECLNNVGLFDEEAFGKGYGEENDFCQRAIKAGWRNIIAADVFVRHWGACSFKGERAKRVQNALKVIATRYPNYQKDVDAFIKKDPLAESRRVLDWHRLLGMRREKNILLINHNRGGGTERRVHEDVQHFLNQGFGVFLLRPYPNQSKFGFIVHPKIKSLPNLRPLDLDDPVTVINLIKSLAITEVHTHSFVDFSSNAPQQIIKAISRLKLFWLVHLHDYKVICPRINLADENGLYCGEPDEAGCNKCLKERKSIFETTAQRYVCPNTQIKFKRKIESGRHWRDWKA